MPQTIDRDEGVGFLSSLGVLCLAADGRWAVKRPGTNGLDGPFKARGRPGFASHWPPWPRPVVLCAGRSAVGVLLPGLRSQEAREGKPPLRNLKNRASSDRYRLCDAGFCRFRGATVEYGAPQNHDRGAACGVRASLSQGQTYRVK